MAKKNQGATPPKPKPPKTTKEIGEGAMLLNGLVTSEEYNVALKGTRRIKTYDEMRKGDPVVKASLKMIKLPLLSAKWRIEPASERRDDREIAEFVEAQIFNQGTRTWQEVLTNVLLHLDYGVMPFEIVYQFLEDGKVGLKKLAVRHPRSITRWELKDGGNGIEQTTINGTFEIPMDKLIIFVNEKEGDNWEGTSLLRSAYKPWFIKDKMEVIEAMAMERQGLGVPFGKTPPNATDDEESKLDEILENMRANEKGYARYPADYEVGWTDMKAGTIKNPKDSIERHERNIMLNVLAAFMMLGQGNVGSFALSKDHSSFFVMSLEYVANHVRDTLNKYLVEKLVDFNYETDKYPKLAYDAIGNVDLDKYTVAFQRAAQVGAITPDSSIERHLRDLFDFPESDGENVDLTDSSMITKPLQIAMDKLITAARGEDGVPAEVQTIYKKVSKFIAETEKAYLNMQKKGQKLTREDMASEHLKRYDQFRKLLDEIAKEMFKYASPSVELPEEGEPAVEATDQKLLDLFASVEKELNTLQS